MNWLDAGVEKIKVAAGSDEAIRINAGALKSHQWLAVVFSWPDNPQNCPFLGDLDPHLIHDSVGSPESSSN